MQNLNVLNTDIEQVRNFEADLLTLPQVDIRTTHDFHAGLYARTIMIPKGTVLTGAQIKIPTMLIVSGDVKIGANRVQGYHVLQGPENRKNAFLALEDTYLTMLFATVATTIEEAEEEFTDEYELLGSRKEGV